MGQLELQLEDKYQDEYSIISLKVELAEAKRINEFLLEQLSKKDEICERLEEEEVLFKEKLEHLKHNLNLLKGSETLDHILNIQIPPLIKIGPGY